MREPPKSALPTAEPSKAKTNMNKLTFTGEWNEVKGKLRQRYAQLTDDDLEYSEGKDAELLGHLQKKLGQAQDEIRKVIAKL